MEQIALKANVREGIGKEKAQKLRRQGLVPAVVYHRGEKSVSIQVVEREIATDEGRAGAFGRADHLFHDGRQIIRHVCFAGDLGGFGGNVGVGNQCPRRLIHQRRNGEEPRREQEAGSGRHCSIQKLPA